MTSASWCEGKAIKGVLLDISGVLRDGHEAIAGSVDAFHKLMKSGLEVRLVTNESQVTRQGSLDTLQSLGYEGVLLENIFAPAPLLAKELLKLGHRPHLLVHPKVKPEFDALIYQNSQSEGVTDPTCVVIADAAEYFTYESMNTAFRILLSMQKKGLDPKLFTLGRGRYYKENGQLWMDVGPFVTALEYGLDIKAELFGKPSPVFFQTALASLSSDGGILADEVVMIGDDIIGDVQGAMDAGMRGVLVRTGKFRPEDENHPTVKPSGIVDNLASAVDLILLGCNTN